MSRFSDFVATRVNSAGRTEKQAEREYSRLVRDGIRDPGQWHAQRYNGLREKAYVNERVVRGAVSAVQAKQEFKRIASTGKDPGVWHARRKEYHFQKPTGIQAPPRGKREISSLSEYTRVMSGFGSDEVLSFDVQEWASSGGGSSQQ